MKNPTSVTAGVWLHGASGRMGREIKKAFDERSTRLRLVGGSDRTFEGGSLRQGQAVTADYLAQALGHAEVQAILDFSSPDGNALLQKALASGLAPGRAVVIGTTGLSDAAVAAWKECATKAELAVLIAPNTSIAILLAAKAALNFARTLTGLSYDIEVNETHHRAKKDAPSGTAKFLVQTIVDGVEGLTVKFNREGERKAGEIGVSSMRGGTVFGEHEIRFIGDADEIRLTHRVFSRELFADGALILADWTRRQKPGFYQLSDVDLGTLGEARV